MAQTKIEWTATTAPDGTVHPGFTFNPWIGCHKVSAQCTNCYAERLAKAYGWAKWGKDEPRHKTSASYWNQPLKWNRKAQELDLPLKVFCASLADVFDNQVPIEWHRELFELIYQTANLDWLLLTKRIENVERIISDAAPKDEFGLPELPRNAWLGISVGTQKDFDACWPVLESIGRHNYILKLFLSIEPLLEELNIEVALSSSDFGDGEEYYGETRTVDWIITGGESGPNARITDPEWYRSLRAQCQEYDVPFFFKQHGEFLKVAPAGDCKWIDEESTIHELKDELQDIAALENDFYYRIGKKRAGRVLDGRTWDEMPR